MALTVGHSYLASIPSLLALLVTLQHRPWGFMPPILASFPYFPLCSLLSLADFVLYVIVSHRTALVQ